MKRLHVVLLVVRNDVARSGCLALNEGWGEVRDFTILEELKEPGISILEFASVDAAISGAESLLFEYRHFPPGVVVEVFEGFEGGAISQESSIQDMLSLLQSVRLEGCFITAKAAACIDIRTYPLGSLSYRVQIDPDDIVLLPLEDARVEGSTGDVVIQSVPRVHCAPLEVRSMAAVLDFILVAFLLIAVNALFYGPEVVQTVLDRRRLEVESFSIDRGEVLKFWLASGGKAVSFAPGEVVSHAFPFESGAYRIAVAFQFDAPRFTVMIDGSEQTFTLPDNQRNFSLYLTPADNLFQIEEGSSIAIYSESVIDYIEFVKEGDVRYRRSHRDRAVRVEDVLRLMGAQHWLQVEGILDFLFNPRIWLFCVCIKIPCAVFLVNFFSLTFPARCFAACARSPHRSSLKAP